MAKDTQREKRRVILRAAITVFARTGYHRGLDRIRGAGWRGKGRVPWSHEGNRGFLRSLAGLSRAAATIGEIDPEEARKLAALGYVGTPRERGSGPLPNPRDEVKNLARIKAAFRFADERRLDEAIAALRSLLQENPKLLDVGSKLGEVLVETGRYEEAIEVYRSAITHAERFSPDLALALGFAMLRGFEPVVLPLLSQTGGRA